MTQEKISEIFYNLESLVNENHEVTSFLLETILPKFDNCDILNALLILIQKNQSQMIKLLNEIMVYKDKII